MSEQAPLNYPPDKYPLSALRGELLGCRRQARVYREAAESEDLYAALFEAEIARREAREANPPPAQN
jgi:hypothetical protein